MQERLSDVGISFALFVVAARVREPRALYVRDNFFDRPL
jgi:hypothetical protein